MCSLPSHSLSNSRERSLSVALLSTHTKEGAGLACARLHHSLCQAGLHSTLYAASLTSGEAGVTFPVRLDMPAEAGKTLRLSTLDRSVEMQAEMMARYPRRDPQREEFSFLTPCFYPDKSPIPASDIVHLHCIARMTDPALFPTFFQRAPLVWTLHDMHPFTGGCHHAEQCEKYTGQCGACPNLGSRKDEDDAYKVWRLRQTNYARLRMQVVCPSQWLADKARTSSLMGAFPIHVIPNGVPLDIYRPLNRQAARKDMGFADHERVIIFAAPDLSSGGKDGQTLLQCLEQLRDVPEAKIFRVVLLGAHPSLEFGEKGIKMDYPGRVDQQEALAALYNAADMLVLPSMTANLPNAIAEAMACGTPAVAYAVGGIPEMIEHRRTGYLAPAGEVDALAQGILWAVREAAVPEVRRLCRVTALERWGLARCAAEYMRVYEDLLGQ